MSETKKETRLCEKAEAEIRQMIREAIDKARLFSVLAQRKVIR